MGEPLSFFRFNSSLASRLLAGAIALSNFSFHARSDGAEQVSRSTTADEVRNLTHSHANQTGFYRALNSQLLKETLTKRPDLAGLLDACLMADYLGTRGVSHAEMRTLLDDYGFALNSRKSGCD